MKGLIVIEGRKEYEEFVKQCTVIKRKGFDDVTYLGMLVIWVDDINTFPFYRLVAERQE